ncbi:type II secretion system protein N [Pseudomonas citri]|uniref:type II secretion system protein N n=1 Tax=Pseudomonas citri TaxID=2978349 RepID=UPI0021B56E72|nr:type II secretion system protein N [Pseudomonas citri]
MSLSFGTTHRLAKVAWVLVPLLYGVFLVGQEWRFRQQLGLDVPVFVAPKVAPVRDLPNVQAVATVLGLTPEDAHAPSAEALTLLASFVAGPGLSRALLADAAGPRMYAMGERLPGGSVLRRVEADHVMLWRNGREERLALQQAAKPLLRRLDPADEPPAAPHSSQYLRPVAGQSE